jgi:hypothetical protein
VSLAAHYAVDRETSSRGVGFLAEWRSHLPRTAAWLCVAVLVAGCGATAEEPPPVGLPTAPASLEPVDCTVTVTAVEQADRALAEAAPGSVVCVSGDGLRDAELVVERSGTVQQPVVLAAEGAQVRSVVVTADFVVVQGFDVVGGTGIVLEGRGLVARGNGVREAAQDGISCEEVCADVLIEGNAVVAADGSGIIVEGQRITVQDNAVSGSVRRDAGDADGIRFFGSDVRLLRNTITDIKDDGYGEDRPHTDCFQTYDNSRIPTVGAVITDNVCRNVDHQCLIATAEESGFAGEVGRSHGIEFARNECAVNGSQAVLVQWFPDVAVRGNTFEGRNDRAAYFGDGSTDGEFTGNTVPRRVRPYQLDEESEPGFTTDVPD